ncbi:MAG: ABC-2 transporter permease [Oscillibacter sp.]
MKALVTKDVYVLLKQMKIFFLAILIFSLLPNLSSNIFAMVYAGMLPYSALAYDERSKWDQLAAMMPYSNKALVVSKYVLGYLFLAISMGLTLAVQLALRVFTHNAVTPAATLITACVAAMLIAATLPFMFRFGVEKGRMVFIFVIVGVAAFAGTLVTSFAEGGNTLPPALMLALPLLAVAVNAVSIPLAIRLYGKRQR